MSQRLQDRSALVTGASRGIGQEIAVRLAAEGARVFCTSTSAGGCDVTVRRIQDAGGQAEAIVCDVGSEADVEALGKHVLAQVPALDILVNNAGITKDGVFLRMSVEDFDRVIDINLRGSFLTCRAFARTMAKARKGRIINVGSVVGLTGNAGQVNYAASKAGLVGLTRSLAKELASRSVTVNLVAPGFISTDMTAGLSEEIRSKAAAEIPLGRFGQPEDVAAAVVFLGSDDAAYITGQVLVVDGGLAM